jgi:hypothetical protein
MMVGQLPDTRFLSECWRARPLWDLEAAAYPHEDEEETERRQGAQERLMAVDRE